MGSLVGISHGYLTLGILVFVTRIPIQALDFQDKVSRFGRVLLSNGNDSQTMAQYATQATPAAKSRNNEAPSSVRKIPYAPTKPRNYNQTADNVTFLLDNLLKDYDNSLRPNIGGEPLMVEINMQVRSMGPISEVDMSYSMDCYFRQSWVDRRLAFSGRKNLALSIEMLRKIWKPDTYIYNGRKSYLHTITTPNKFMRLFPNGRVLYSQRLTIKASCQMDLSDFPMDKQKCPLQIGSFGYTINDVIYQWTAGRGVNIASDMKLSQFDLISTPTGNSTTFLNKGRHSTLVVGFHLQRHMGNFVIQVYGPCVLLVVISWVSFWLNREATSDRISLGVTTVLTMTFLGLEARTDLPQVAYATALDYFVFVSFMSIFATVTQFAVVHYFTKVGSGEYYLEELEETFCALEMKRKLILEQGLFGMFYDDADEDQDPNDEEFNDYGEDEVLIGDHNQHPSGMYHHYRDHNGQKKTQYMEEISLIGNSYISANSEPKINEFQTPDPEEYLEQTFLHHNHYHTSTPNFQDAAYRTLPAIGNHSNSSFLTPTPPPPPLAVKSRPVLTFQDDIENSSSASKEKNYLNHHPYGTFYYSKKNGRCGKRATASHTLRKSQSMISKGSYHTMPNGRRRTKGQNGTQSISTLGRSVSSTSNLINAGSKDGNWNSGEPSDLEQCGCKRCVTRALTNTEKALNSVSRIDKISRVVFPLSFFVINLFYWYKYLNHSERIDLSFETD